MILALLLFVGLVPSICPAQDPWNQSQQFMLTNTVVFQQQSSMPQPTQSHQLMSISPDGSQQQSSMLQPTPPPQSETPATSPPPTQPQTDVPFVNSSGNGEMCPSQIDEIWGIVWPETESGTVAILHCPPGFKGFATRFCGIIDWEVPDFYNCVGKELDGVNSQVCNMHITLMNQNRKEIYLNAS